MDAEDIDEVEEVQYESDTEYDIIIDKSESTTNYIEDIETFKKDYNKNKKDNITPPNLNKYELTRVLCERTQQIENGGMVYISNTERFTNAYSIALEELKQKKIPFIIRRPLPNLLSYEYWKLKDMVY